MSRVPNLVRVEQVTVLHFDDGTTREASYELTRFAPVEPPATNPHQLSMLDGDPPPLRVDPPSEPPPRPTWQQVCEQFEGLQAAVEAIEAASARGYSDEAIAAIINNSMHYTKANGGRRHRLVEASVTALRKHYLVHHRDQWRPGQIRGRHSLLAIAAALRPILNPKAPNGNDTPDGEDGDE